jgi:sigma-E factor negative regulatory protein RseA
MTNRNPTTPTSGDAPLSREALSCLIDGELDAAECAKLIGRLGTDRTARREWLLLHVVGDALRSSDVASLQSERFLQRMGAALEAEPPIVAPHASRARARLVRRVVLPGAAAVAAATMLVVIAVPQLRGDAPGATQTATVAATENAGTSPAATPVAPVATLPAAAGGNEVHRLAELEAYLVAHRELAGSSMMPRTAAYLRASAAAQR